ncbi:MAG: hypothetical protein M3Q66_03800, partial [Chloroflexota bacterium]|nr:hypothetical protein [Chloroflexota bacterium]
MTDADPGIDPELVGLSDPALATAPRRRAGGRAGHERHVLPQQRSIQQPRIRYEPTRVLSDDELESIHVA